MQQINLYTQELRPKKIVLPLWQMVAGTIVLLVVLVAVTFYYRTQVIAMEAKLSPVEQRVEQLQQQFTTMERKLSELQKDESLVALNKRLSKRVTARKQLISMLDSVVTANNFPFSHLMIGLARHRVDRLWLTKIQFVDGGAKVGISGKTTKAEAVPHYLQMLRGETLFLGQSFNLFELASDEKQKDLLHFTLSSSLLNSEKEQ